MSEEERTGWVKAIQDVSGVRRFEDYYEKGMKIGEGRFAVVYRVCDSDSDSDSDCDCDCDDK